MKRALIILVIGIIFVILSLDERVILTPSVNKITNDIGQAQTELVLCLKYIKIGPFVFVYDYKFPAIVESTLTSAKHGHCAKNYNILFHNHPKINLFNPPVREYYKKYTGEGMTNTVFLSHTDTRNIDYYDYMMVRSTRSWAWWRKDQIEPNTLQLPIEGQFYEHE